MPIYEYLCPKCGHRFEELILRKSDEEEVVCEKCGFKKPTRELSSFSGGGKQEGSSGASCSAPSGFS
jgi:putative FmdB family regulatory protein